MPYKMIIYPANMYKSGQYGITIELALRWLARLGQYRYRIGLAGDVILINVQYELCSSAPGR